MKHDRKIDPLCYRTPYELGSARHSWYAQLITSAKDDFIGGSDASRLDERHSSWGWVIRYHLHAVHETLRSHYLFRPSNAQETSKLISSGLSHDHLLACHVCLEVMSDWRILRHKCRGRAGVDIDSSSWG